MAAATRDIIVEVGATYSKSWHVENSDGSNFDLSLYTADAQIRESPDSKYPLASFVCTITNPSTTNSLAILLDSGVTSTLKVGRYIWDLRILSSPSTVIRLLAGVATVVQGATRS